ncbi:hypothetical protein [Prevotella pectinovora]|uniref:hypothetical protein n=1 Tax=Prevotella pectinovora TaxID=1602169 RepID=UPI0012E05700|nr:hypothetical protein [Prevotella pectinovora]
MHPGFSVTSGYISEYFSPSGNWLPHWSVYSFHAMSTFFSSNCGLNGAVAYPMATQPNDCTTMSFSSVIIRIYLENATHYL